MRRMLLTLWAVGLFLLAQSAQAGWAAAKRITWTSGGCFNPAIAVDASGNPHVVWYGEVAGQYDVYYRKSSDGGSSWGIVRKLKPTSGFCPAIAIDSSGHLHVVWHGGTVANYEIYYAKSTDGGATWTSGKRLIWNSGSSQEPDIAVDSLGNLHVIWRDETPGNAEIYYKRSSDGGTTWASTKRLTWTPGYSEYASLAVDPSGNPHVVWDDDTPGNTDIYYLKSTNGGTTWTSIKRLTSTSGWPGDPEIAADSLGRLHLIFHYDKPGNDEIYYKKSADAGGTWSPNRRLTWTTGSSWGPSVAVDPSDFLHVVYYDDTPGNDEIYYLQSPDGGASWTSGQRLTWTSGWSRQPAIAAYSSSNLHVVWFDNTPGNYEIFYKNGN